MSGLIRRMMRTVSFTQLFERALRLLEGAGMRLYAGEHAFVEEAGIVPPGNRPEGMRLASCRSSLPFDLAPTF